MSTHTHTPMLGNARKFYIGTGTGTISYTWLAGEQNNSVTLNGGATLFFTTFTLVRLPMTESPCFMDSTRLTSSLTDA